VGNVAMSLFAGMVNMTQAGKLAAISGTSN
jgi:hypothetical protein